MPALFNEVDLYRWLDDRTITKAVAYLDRVHDLRTEGDMLRAEVEGTDTRPYRVAIDLRTSLRNPLSRLHGRCSCPVGDNCKHVAAVMMRALHGPEEESEVGLPQDAQLVRAELLTRLSEWHDQHAERTGSQTRKPNPKGIAFVLSVFQFRLGIHAYRVRKTADDTVQREKLLEITPDLFLDPPGYLSQQDVAVLGQLWLRQQRKSNQRVAMQPLLDMILASGHGGVSYSDSRQVLPLRVGPARKGHLAWEPTENEMVGWLRPVLRVDGDVDGAVGDHFACYLDERTGEIGPLDLSVASEDADAFLGLPPLLPDEHALTAQMLQQLDAALPLPPSTADALPIAQVDGMIPHLMLHTEEQQHAWGARRGQAQRVEFATVSFAYGDHFKHLDDSSRFVRVGDGTVELLPRDTAEEARRESELRRSGLHRHPHSPALLSGAGPHFHLRSYDWGSFMLHELPKLQALGWVITVPEDFRHRITVVDSVLWDVELDGTAAGWMTVALDIEVDGHTVALAPMLAQLLQSDPRWTRGPLDAIDDDERILIASTDAGALSFQAKRLKPVVALLGDLLDKGAGPLRISARDRGRLQALQQSGSLQLRGAVDTRAMVQRLLQEPTPKAVAAPVGLAAVLRPYQLDGLAWLQYLRQQELGGILADDMGLGKTLQTLAHVLLEKESGRLDRPALVVMPTSLLFNWQEEAARFAPDLRVLILHGPAREALFEQIPAHDLVLTTYPLVWRDEAALQAHPYHLLILDEAQQVKNAKARAAITLRTLQSRHRLCLTGTPLENHLGELWTHIDFVLPGLLGSEKLFNQHWRHPIERSADAQRAQLLAQRVRPFILRRRKDQVATELPPKTVITRHVALEGSQRDLYETVRSAMQEKVREAVTGKGLAKSHIVVLDALLKLRQVCCDPRLLPGDAAPRTQGSAKLDLLMTLLPGMVEEGRSILVFSQFTRMLELIAQALDKSGLAFVTLTGDTRDRATPVRRFMQGEVPIFLISLKAGGVGLNLTAADTVIHFDPWWNPAAENQASDRAHRIGQDKPVFVYRLIAAGSIEERITELQQRKASLADSILENGSASGPGFSESDLNALLEPLPGAPAKKGKGVRKAAHE
ncbi:DEAD/DEAH box helicase [Stenotrophomonas sp. WHRI 8082]|uniref:DEAD/DEAH box helicase n=1 Tax=Stenotrophomonas sp. WHRI 8082 TaxID=3162571 RepID=UPI0032EB6131